MSHANRTIDKTYLSLDAAEERGLIHRDYIAHCFRWSHVVKHLNQRHTYKEAIVLDVGCGKEMPLAKTLYVNKMTPRLYVGVDANKFEIPEMLRDRKIPVRTWQETDFCALDISDVGFVNGRIPELPGYESIKEYGINFHNQRWVNIDPDGTVSTPPNIFTCFEVLEHVTPEHARRMLQHAMKITSPDCHFFISTPCWNGAAAANHINEMTFAALGSLIEDLGFKIEGVYGTFASISDYADELGAVTVYDKNTGRAMAPVDISNIFAALRNYYDTNVLSTIFAPLFPSKSRNALWHLSKKSSSDRAKDQDSVAQGRMFTKLSQSPTPWSQHPDWRSLDGPADQS